VSRTDILNYVNYECVLVRLGRVKTEAVRDLLLAGWRFVSGARRPRRTTPPARRAGKRARVKK
jgi:hypothetical protein